jgi:hypothetical protein
MDGVHPAAHQISSSMVKISEDPQQVVAVAA